MFCVLFVLNNPEKVDELLDAWARAGVSGATVLVSTGLERVRSHHALPEDLPLIPRLEDFLHHSENMNRTLFTIVDSQAQVDRVIAATEQVVGDLDLPDSGILAVIPVVQARGLRRREKEEQE